MDTHSYTDQAVDAIVQAVEREADFAGWLGRVLGHAAAECGSTAALTAGRPGSWEAEKVRELVCGTVGWDDDFLSDYRRKRDHD
jgi:hypothetical protein